MTPDATSRIINAPPLLTPSDRRRRTESADAGDLTPDELAPMRLQALVIQDPPPRSIDEIPNWVLEGG